MSYEDTLRYPHRDLIVNHLKKLQPFGNLLEVGCGEGQNLVRIARELPDVKLTGLDINNDYLQTARDHVGNARIDGGNIELLPYEDNSFDIVLSVASLIYLGPTQMKLAMHQIKRVAKKRVVFLEFMTKHVNEALLLTYVDHYWPYDYEDLLTNYGYKNIEILKIDKDVWPTELWEHYGHLITAEKNE